MIKLKYGDKHDFQGCENAIKLKDEEVQELIDEVLEDLEEEKNDYGNSYVGTGDTMVFGFKYKDEKDVYVCRNYEEAQIYLDDEGEWTKQDWLYDYENEDFVNEENIEALLNQLSKEEIVDILKKVIESGRKMHHNDGDNN